MCNIIGLRKSKPMNSVFPGGDLGRWRLDSRGRWDLHSAAVVGLDGGGGKTSKGQRDLQAAAQGEAGDGRGRGEERSMRE